MLESDLSLLRSPKQTRKSDLKVELIINSSFLVVARMNKESLHEKDSETFMNPCHLETMLQPIKDLCSTRRFPKQAGTSFQGRNHSQIGSP